MNYIYKEEKELLDYNPDVASMAPGGHAACFSITP
jgi:hypothetical protein